MSAESAKECGRAVPLAVASDSFIRSRFFWFKSQTLHQSTMSAMVKATAALDEFLNSSGFVCSVCGPVGSGKLTLVTRMAIANGFELVEFEPGKAEANSNKTLHECVPEPRKVAYFWRGNQLPPGFEPGGTKLFVIGRWKCPGLPFVQVPPPTDVEMHQAVDAFLTGNVTGPAGCDWHDAMMALLRQRRQDAPALSADVKRAVVLYARNDYRQLLLHLIIPGAAKGLSEEVEKLKVRYQPEKKKAGAPKKGVPDARKTSELEQRSRSAGAKVLNDMFSCCALPVIPSVACSRCKFSHRGCKECWERLAASLGEELPEHELHTRLQDARNSKKRLPWKAVDTQAGLLGDEETKSYMLTPQQAASELTGPGLGQQRKRHRS